MTLLNQARKAPVQPVHIGRQGARGLFLRPLVQACALAWGLVGQAQAQPPLEQSLTEEFPGLSAKERSRIAKKEVEEARADTAFQAIMVHAEDLFRQARYEQALEAYRLARVKRPYNVYPKVKIHDLEAMLAARPSPVPGDPAQEPPPAATAPEQPGPAAPIPAPAVVPVAPAMPIAPVVAPKPVGEGPVQRPVPVPAINSPQPALVRELPVASTPAAVPPDGVEERQYRQGNAYVIERRVTEEGHTTVYKRVIHSWGARYHFKDGEAIDERVWNERFPEP